MDDPIGEGAAAALDGSRERPERILNSLMDALFVPHLSEDPRWSPYWWIDGAMIDGVHPIDDTTLQVTGVLVPSDEQNQRIAPFVAVVRIDRPSNRLTSYRLRFGEAGADLTAVPYGSTQPPHWDRVCAWEFGFSSPG